MKNFINRYWHLGATALTLSLSLTYLNSDQVIFKKIASIPISSNPELSIESARKEETKYPELFNDPIDVNLSAKQIKNLQLAYQVAREYKLKIPSAYQGILMQETLAGEYGGYHVAGQEFGLQPLKRYYGLGQIKVSAAWDVVKTHPELHSFSIGGRFKTDEELIALLITNDEFNIRVGARYFQMMGRGNISLNQQVTAYNRGYEGAKLMNYNNFDYTKKVLSYQRGVITKLNSKVHHPIYTIARN